MNATPLLSIFIAALVVFISHCAADGIIIDEYLKGLSDNCTKAAESLKDGECSETLGKSSDEDCKNGCRMMNCINDKLPNSDDCDVNDKKKMPGTFEKAVESINSYCKDTKCNSGHQTRVTLVTIIAMFSIYYFL